MSGLYRAAGKRLLDLAIAGPVLLLLSPLMAILAILVARDVGRPVFFRQQRPGLRGRPFLLFKFRTMRDTGATAGNLLPDADRLTRFGSFLRSTSLDELPELLNVLKGEMSLVGPRPLLMQYLGRYTTEQMRRHEVRPGMTGWAQINGRNAIDWEQKFMLDVWYVDHVSFRLDITICLLTAIRIVKRHGINEPGQATAQEFMGSQN